MPRHNVRPKVIAAIADLQSFTVPELRRRAKLTNRAQADNQIRRLVQEGYLEKEQLPGEGAAHRPPLLYKLTSDPGQRRKLTEELLTYFPAARPPANEAVIRDVTRNAGERLDGIEMELDQISRSADPPSALRQLRGLDRGLEFAFTRIKTALVEYGDSVGEERTPENAAILLQARWHRISERRHDLQAEFAVQETAEKAKELTRAAAATIADAETTAVRPEPEPLFHQLKDALSGYDKAIVERLLDQIVGLASVESIVGSVFRYACSVTRDPRVVADVSDTLTHHSRPWLEFNKENARILSNGNVDWDLWRSGYRYLQDKFDDIRCPRHAGTNLRVYSCPSSQFTRKAYLALSGGQSLSVIAPHQIGFLGPSEPVEPVLVWQDHESRLKTFTCSYLNPYAPLHVYGVIAQEISSIPGAPSARVAACLGALGLEIEIGRLVSEIRDTLERHEALVVIQASGEHAGLSARVRQHLPDAHEITAV